MSIEIMKSLIRSQSMGVLAVLSEGRPHCALMAYVCDESAERLFFVTLKNTAKYRAILRHETVGFLIDTRCEGLGDRSRIQALTLSGVCRPIMDAGLARAIRGRILENHPHLTDLIADPEAAVLEYSIHCLQLQDGPLRQFKFSFDGGAVTS
ncbi:pyridoxamine 5'-phosphate oxidase family protein [Desulfatirhabdium butyrativorans]|uniref:pyridoxamine 5'-phosphate oxidase family protein n=1 Tax=Desulfatirhabdium butyrativorans TaxID=340467 RepID=UPI000420F41D|nr:pyridoxamine 5'-phosphate oxidase family protein [Desulfatirhabdium butyrativorans]